MTFAPIYQNVDTALELITEWKKDHSIAFTNGCFDILHKGHITYLGDCKNHAGKLIVGLNSDKSVKELKGKNRPIQDQNSRASILAALRSVDMVIFFNEATPLQIIKKINPNLIIKGGDYSELEMIGREHVLTYGGNALILPFEEGYSTSKIIDKIKST